MKVKTVNIPIYFGTLRLYNVKDLGKISKKYGLEDLSQYSAITFRIQDKKEGDVYIIAFSKKHVNARIIAHESLHATGLIFEDRAMPMDLDNDEPQCYLHGWIVEKCHKFIYGKMR